MNSNTQFLRSLDNPCQEIFNVSYPQTANYRSHDIEPEENDDDDIDESTVRVDLIRDTLRLLLSNSAWKNTERKQIVLQEAE